MTSKERFTRMYQHKEADLIPITDVPWAGTFRRWHNEGLPTDVELAKYLGLDLVADFG